MERIGDFLDFHPVLLMGSIFHNSGMARMISWSTRDKHEYQSVLCTVCNDSPILACIHLSLARLSLEGVDKALRLAVHMVHEAMLVHTRIIPCLTPRRDTHEIEF